jgi:hypothetical protein
MRRDLMRRIHASFVSPQLVTSCVVVLYPLCPRRLLGRHGPDVVLPSSWRGPVVVLSFCLVLPSSWRGPVVVSFCRDPPGVSGLNAA